MVFATIASTCLVTETLAATKLASAAGLLDHPDGAFATFGHIVGDHYFGAFSRKLQRGGAAYTRSAASHQCDFTLYESWHGLDLRWIVPVQGSLCSGLRGLANWREQSQIAVGTAGPIGGRL